MMAAFGLYTCSDSDGVIAPNGQISPGKGAVTFFLTDGPCYGADITGVFITVESVEANGPNGWKTVFSEKKTFNLLDYQNGISVLLSTIELDTGHYKGLRVNLDVAEDGDEKPEHGCFLRFKKNKGVGLCVAKGYRSGLTVKGAFDVKEGKETSITIDFDARKSIHRVDRHGKYRLRPCIRLIVNYDMGALQGLYPDVTQYERVVVFAYKAGTFTPEEIDEAGDNPPFSNASGSSVVDAQGNFRLAFLPEGTYDLYVAAFTEDGYLLSLITNKKNLEVVAQESEQVNL